MKILVCSDGRAQADKAISFGGLIAGAAGAEVTILGITEGAAVDPMFDSLKKAQQRLKDTGINAEVAIKPGEPIAEITRRTKETAFDLIVIGAVRKGVRGPFLMSAKAYEIIKAVQPPVLVVIGDRPALKRILICSGGERYIHRAVEMAGKFAEGLDASITLLHVMAEPPSLYADLIMMEEDASLLLNSDSDLGRNLRREKEALDALGIQTEVRLRHGLVTDEIFKEIKSGDYDLVVTGSAPNGDPLRTYIMGNITREIVNKADCPVLVVRSDAELGGLTRSLKTMFSDITHALSHQKHTPEKK